VHCIAVSAKEETKIDAFEICAVLFCAYMDLFCVHMGHFCIYINTRAKVWQPCMSAKGETTEDEFEILFPRIVTTISLGPRFGNRT